jgi:hypothetical protein
MLDHPNLVECKDVIRSPRQMVLVLEWLRCVTCLAAQLHSRLAAQLHCAGCGEWLLCPGAQPLLCFSAEGCPACRPPDLVPRALPSPCPFYTGAAR